jgi:hypothetical protein
MRCLPRFSQPGVSFVEHPHSVRRVYLTGFPGWLALEKMSNLQSRIRGNDGILPALLIACFKG